ncbi:MAG: hypothetical protein QOE22_674 [Candidatus Parcubacteria bacterium]|jgi:hypothetical protein|nr:hypothetical protein [Candidatus Parcubacteria bacterium]
MPNPEFLQPNPTGKPPVPPVLASVDDFLDSQEIYTRLKRLPPELRARHLERITIMEEAEDADDIAIVAYLDGILEKRKEAMQESVVSDPSIQEYFGRHAEEIWKEIETDVFNDADSLLGRGQTARVMRYELDNPSEDFSAKFAVKYLVTPSEKTLSASGEHDLLMEVERIEQIERAEAMRADEVKHFRVPHPYFHHQRGELQCYGMELVDGLDLQQYVDGKGDEKTRSDIRAALHGINREALFREVDIFFSVMHTICLHGDMLKLGNLMVNREGRFYVIDFGQSVLANDIDEKSQESFGNLKEDEIRNTKLLLTQFLNALEA